MNKRKKEKQVLRNCPSSLLIIKMADVQENRQQVAYTTGCTNSTVVQLHMEYRKSDEFTSLYMLLLTAINTYCNRDITLKPQEPVVERLLNNLWAIISKKQLTMLCHVHNSETSHKIITKSPVGVIHLLPSCSLTDLVRLDIQQEFYHTLQLPTWTTDNLPISNISRHTGLAANK